MCKHTQIPFLLDCSFKICEKTSKFSKSVCVVNGGHAIFENIKLDLLTILARCLHSRWLRWHRVGVVVDYAWTHVSHILRTHAKWKSSQNHFCLFMGPRWNLLSKKKFLQKSCDTVPLKGQCHEIFWPIFLAEKIRTSPIWTGKSGLSNFFVFVKTFYRKERKSGGRGHPNFSLDTAVSTF